MNRKEIKCIMLFISIIMGTQSISSAPDSNSNKKYAQYVTTVKNNLLKAQQHIFPLHNVTFNVDKTLKNILMGIYFTRIQTSAYPITRNYMGTCYLNSSLAALLTLKPIREHISKDTLPDDHTMQNSIESDIKNEFLQIAKQVKEEPKKPLDPKKLHYLLNKKSYEEHAPFLLRVFCNYYAPGGNPGNALTNIIQSTSETTKSVNKFDDLFTQTWQTNRQCKLCGTIYTDNTEKLLWTSLPVSIYGNKKLETFYKCGHERSMPCDQCNKKTPQIYADKKLINRPEIFAFELGDAPDETKNRLCNLYDVAIPKELNVSKFSDNKEEPIYKLKSFIVFKKDAPVNHGYTYSKINGVWHYIEDENVNKGKSLSELIKNNQDNATPWFLFYEKRREIDRNKKWWLRTSTLHNDWN